MSHDHSSNAADRLMLYGDGRDGDITFSSGVTYLYGDKAYKNVTFSGTGVLRPNGFRVRVSDVLDFTDCTTYCITSAGVSATGQSPASGAAGGTLSSGGLGAGGASGPSGAGEPGYNSEGTTYNPAGGGGAGGPGGESKYSAPS
jgi:hypothetical protein